MPSLDSIPTPLVIGHRGYRSRYPENTLVALEAAYAAGAGMVEFDVALSRDRNVVVMHDRTVDRTTDGSGPLRSHTLASLKRLDAGGWFDPRFAGEPVPTLAEVLRKIRPRRLVNIEIKSEAFEAEPRKDAIERQVPAMLQIHGFAGQALISSFDARILSRIRNLENPPALGVLTGRRAPSNLLELCRSLQAFSWHPHVQGCNTALVSAARQAGLRVFPYTADTPAAIRRLLGMRVDGFFTDDPAAAVEYVNAMKSRDR